MKIKELTEELDKDYCLYEGCHYYDLAVHDELNYPLYLLVDDNGEDDFDLGYDIVHVVAKNPESDSYIDVKGERSLKEIEDDYHVELRPIQISKQELLSLMGDTDDKPLFGLDQETYQNAVNEIRKKK